VIEVTSLSKLIYASVSNAGSATACMQEISQAHQAVAVQSVGGVIMAALFLAY
jgi:predicted transcriptional regulator